MIHGLYFIFFSHNIIQSSGPDHMQWCGFHLISSIQPFWQRRPSCFMCSQFGAEHQYSTNILPNTVNIVDSTAYFWKAVGSRISNIAFSPKIFTKNFPQTFYDKTFWPKQFHNIFLPNIFHPNQFSICLLKFWIFEFLTVYLIYFCNYVKATEKILKIQAHW